jgi:hypothetical protein
MVVGRTAIALLLDDVVIAEIVQLCVSPTSMLCGHDRTGAMLGSYRHSALERLLKRRWAALQRAKLFWNDSAVFIGGQGAEAHAIAVS